MSNTLLTISMITREVLRVLENQLVFTKKVDRQYDDYFAKAGAKIGNTLNIRKPSRYMGRIGATLATEDATEKQVALTLSNQIGVDLTFTSQDLTLSIDDFAKRFIKPAIAVVANKIDFDGLAQFVNIYNEVGTPGTVPNSLLTYLQARQRQNEESVPDDQSRCFVLSPAQEAVLVNALTGLFNPTGAIGAQYEKGKMGHAIGYDWYMSQNAPAHTIGVATGTPTVKTTSSEGDTTLATQGWTASKTGIVKKGDIFTVAAVNAVNVLNKQSSGALRQFVVTADANSDVSGLATISVSPVINSLAALGQGFASAFATVDVLPQANAVITVQGAGGTASLRGLAFHEEAFALGSADLLLPGGVDMASRVADKDVGLSVRLVRQYAITSDTFPCRLDVLYGWTTLYPEFACRIAS